jgi:hypothetical protein
MTACALCGGTEGGMVSRWDPQRFPKGKHMSPPEHVTCPDKENGTGVGSGAVSAPSRAEV